MAGTAADAGSSGLAGRRLFVGTPMFDGRCHAPFAFALVQLGALCAQLGVALHCFFATGEALIGKARNITVDEFLRSDSDHLLFVDSDIGFDPRDAMTLLRMQVEDRAAAYDVVAAPYPLKRIAWEGVLHAAKAGFADGAPDRLARVASGVAVHPAHDGEVTLTRPLEVSHAGTGFMMIRRQTFDRLHATLPRPTYRPTRVGLETHASDRIIAFFEPEIGAGLDIAAEMKAFLKRSPDATAAEMRAFLERNTAAHPAGDAYYSEDYAFCRAVRRAGMGVWLCPWMELTHTGSHRFTSRLADFAAIGGA